MKNGGICGKRAYYKPIDHQFCYDAYKMQHQMHWTPEEVNFSDDRADWANKLTDGQKNFLTQIFRFFTQADVDVAQAYMHKYSPCFHKPEVLMMFSAFAAMEAIHIDSYSKLIDTVGMPESEYSAFLQYKAMCDKHEYLTEFDIESPEGLCRSLAVYSAFTEGLQLFSSFAMLLSFPSNHYKLNLMRGMGQVVTFSIRDESLHVDSMIKVFRTLVEDQHELGTKIVTPKFIKDIQGICEDMVRLEDAFIELAFDSGGVDHMCPDEVKTYIRYIADRRLIQLGVKPIYDQRDNPFTWVDLEVGAVEHTNFFENRPTTYTKGGVTDDWDKVFPIDK